MSGQGFYQRARVAELLDAAGDLAPPWERFPTYERHTIGWRMGDGEGWLGLWNDFLDGLDPAYEARLAYLRRHPPAPVTWAETVHDVLHPGADESRSDDEDAETERRDALLRAGLIASDAAYPTWLAQQTGVRRPWELSCGDTPEGAARWPTREFWFCSRQIAAARAVPGWQTPTVPRPWRHCEEPLVTGRVRAPDLRQGLLTLAQLLAAGRVVPPWQFGLTVATFADSFEPDMGFADAYRLWGMSVFDDLEQVRTHLADAPPPPEWAEWVADQFPLFG